MLSAATVLRHHQDMPEGNPCILLRTFYLGYLVTYFLSKYNAPWTVIFFPENIFPPRKWVLIARCPFIFHQFQHISLRNECGNAWGIFRARGIFRAGGKRRRAGTAIPFRTGRQCSVNPWQTSPPIRGYPLFSSDPGNQGCFGCSHSCLGLAAPSHSPNYFSAWRCLEHWGWDT